MEQLPDELLTRILDYLEPLDIVWSQRVSKRLAKVSRDNILWRYKCFDKSPSTGLVPHRLLDRSRNSGSHSELLQTSNGSTTGLDHAEAPQTHLHMRHPKQRHNMSRRAREVADWDYTKPTETVDWYSEYVGRHATLSTIWLGENLPEVRGLALLDSQQAVGPLDDGSLCIWNVRDRETASGGAGRSFYEVSRSSAGLLLADYDNLGEPSSRVDSKLSFSGVGECITVDSNRKKAYVAVADVLNEVDLETLRVVSQNKFAWSITALSQIDLPDQPLTIGTTWSLHLHDPRVQIRDRSRSPEDYKMTSVEEPEESIAFLPNYSKIGHQTPIDSIFRQSLKRLEGQVAGASEISGTLPSRRRRFRRADLGDCAQCEPGPLSIVHHGRDSIIIAGRFPSILCYDRRFFPCLETVIHSGARLSSLSILSHPPVSSGHDEATLLACGEYNGRGSLEMYTLPYSKEAYISSSLIAEGDLGLISQDLRTSDTDHLSRESSRGHPLGLTNYKNRQSASSAKLLSVTAHGTRIVSSDADGGLKWVERDCSSLVRRWNINEYSLLNTGSGNQQRSSALVAGVQGDQVVRKLIPMDFGESERGTRGDGDLLVWTGERVGVVTFRPPEQVDAMHDLADTFAGSSSLENVRGREVADPAEEYGQVMRRALERQTDEINWMRRLGMRP